MGGLSIRQGAVAVRTTGIIRPDRDRVLQRRPHDQWRRYLPVSAQVVKLALKAEPRRRATQIAQDQTSTAPMTNRHQQKRAILTPKLTVHRCSYDRQPLFRTDR